MNLNERREFFFKCLYFLINFFIVIGEWTQRILFFVFFKLSLKSFFIIKDFFLLFFKKIWQFLFKLIKKIFFILKNFFKVSLTVLKAIVEFPKKIFSRIKLPSWRLKISFDFISLRLRYFILGAIFSFLIILVYQLYLFVKNLPSPINIGKLNYPLSTHIYDRNGKLLYEIYREQNRTPIKIKNLPLTVIQATIAIEDKGFYKHQGVSLVGGVLRAIKETILKKELQGGSTITQQLVKSALLTPERTLTRKIKEIILALWTEKIFSKDEILEMYLNQVPYGGAAYGIEEAAKTYFNKKAKDLNLTEAALLAGLPQAPSLYSPYNNPDLARQRRNLVLEAMYEMKYIDKATKIKAQNLKLEVVPFKTTIKAPHFVFFVKSQLEEKYGIKMVEEGGLRVYTSLDLDLQEKLETILKEEIEKIRNLNVSNGAILVTRPQTGEILAMLGSVDYFNGETGAFNVTTSLRQPGSSIKPIMYSLALEKGFTAATIIDDSPVVFNIPGSTPYRPVNYDGRFHGKVTLRLALANSFNVPAVKVLNVIGVENFVSHAKKIGISTWNDSSRFGLSLTLGGGEVKMVDIVQAFGVFANLGERVSLESVLEIKNLNDKTIYRHYPLKERVLKEGTAFIISEILADNFSRQWAFGSHSALEIPGYKVAVKTGTTDEKRDNWTIGYTPEFLVAVWVGNNDNSPMNPYLTSGITGAAPIWNRVMSYLLNNYGNGKQWFEKPDDVVEKSCFFGKTEYFLKGTENLVSCRDGLFKTSITPTGSH
ncbi:MAG: PBP1A family penicillin-binding protein [Patescibacteria group bacterium]|nr:PBP1A family penicillin-binding protein [Patescibacteria group bacterium]